MTAAPGVGLRVFTSLAGRLALLLTAGTLLGAVAALFVAQHMHREALRRLRLEAVVSTADEVAGRFAAEPDATARILSAGLIHNVRLLPSGAMVTRPAPLLTSALLRRFGAAAAAMGQVEPHGLCHPGKWMEPGEVAGAWRLLPDCWLVTFHDRRGVRRALAVSMPRYLSDEQSLFDPVYLTLIILVSAALATLVALLAVSPLRRLTRAAEAFSIAQEPGLLPERGPWEVRTAIASFNRMQRRVDEGHRERIGMLAAISHDLQTPLTRLRLWLDEVADEAMRVRLGSDLAVMQAIVRDGLELARSSDRSEPWSIVDIDSLVQSIAADAAELGADVTVGAPCGLDVTTRIDAITRCLTNLVDNAVKYGGSARIDCDGAPDAVAIHVSDRGPGIPPDEIERMFAPFARGDGSRSRATGGTGLGLAIARAQARSIDGDVTLRGAAGGGVVATLLIRRGAAVGPAAVPTSPPPVQLTGTSR